MLVYHAPKTHKHSEIKIQTGDCKMKYKVLMIGLNRSFIPALEKNNQEIEVYLIEEQELLENNKKKPFHSSIIKSTKTGAYQQSDGLIEIAQQWHQEIGFDVVVAGVEYAVYGAGLVAEKLDLRYLGLKSVKHLTNKLWLRQLCEKSGIGHPRFQNLEDVSDVHNFFQGKTIVIKPANRQASTGVIKIENKGDIDKAYTEMLNASEGNRVVNRPMHWQYLAEEYMPGLEVSVETIVQNDKAIFHNITEKKITDNNYFVEVGHIVPARLEEFQVTKLLAEQEKLVAALEAQNGFLHAEWKITDEGPKLIECAGRVAGDRILDLIELAYGFNIYALIIQVLAGETLLRPQQAVIGSCICYFEAQPGTLKEIIGTELLTENNPNLIDWSITVTPNDIISPLTSSWSRIGYVIVTGQNNDEAYQRGQNLVNQIQFVVN
jgi:biotin carboxylase